MEAAPAFWVLAAPVPFQDSSAGAAVALEAVVGWCYGAPSLWDCMHVWASHCCRIATGFIGQEVVKSPGDVGSLLPLQTLSSSVGPTALCSPSVPSDVLHKLLGHRLPVC